MPHTPRRAGPAGRFSIFVLALLIGCGAAGEGPSDEQERGREEPASGRADEAARPELGRAWVVFGPDTVVVEVARTAEERAVGLMNRDEVPEGTGMLFVFEDEEIRSFWMQDTFVPLDIAYMDAGLRIVDIQQMDPETTDLHESAAPAMFALEVRQGWFADRGIEVGDVAEVVF